MDRHLYKIFSALFVFLILSVGVVSGQDKSDLQKKRSRILKEINITKQLIAKNVENQNLTSNEVKVLDKQISLRQSLISNINTEVRGIKDKIKSNEQMIASLETSLAAIKDEYAQLVYLAYKNKNTQDKLMYIFASDDFFQAMRRVQFLKDIGAHRKEQAEVISKTKLSIDEKNKVLVEQKSSKEALLRDAISAKNNLNKDRRLKEEALSKISQDKDKLLSDLGKKKKERQKLQSAIKKLIAAEMKKNSSSTASGEYKATPEEKLKSQYFSKNKGKLPWPVEKGVIIDGFGTKAHETMKGIKITNNGIDIATELNSSVRSIFEGEVSAVFSIPGSGKAVLVKHGEYRVVYSNLKDVWVEKGQTVDTKQDIGVLNSDGKQSISHIEIWKMTTKEDPELWISK